MATPPPATHQPGEVRYTTLPDAIPSALVVVQGAELNPAQQSALAGYAELGLRSVEALISAGLPVPVSGHSSLDAARREAVALSARSQLPAQSVRIGIQSPAAMRQGIPLIAWSIWAVFVAAVALPVLLVSGLAALPWVALGALLSALPLWLFQRSASSDVAYRAITAWHQALQARERQAAGGALVEVWARVAEVRRGLAGATLPEPAGGDVRSALRALEVELMELGPRMAATQRALSLLDGPSQAPLQLQRDAQHQTLERATHALDELQLSLALSPSATGSDALSQLATTSRLLREAASEVAPARPSKPRQRTLE